MCLSSTAVSKRRYRKSKAKIIFSFIPSLLSLKMKWAPFLWDHCLITRKIPLQSKWDHICGVSPSAINADSTVWAVVDDAGKFYLLCCFWLCHVKSMEFSYSLCGNNLEGGFISPLTGRPHELAGKKKFAKIYLQVIWSITRLFFLYK